MIVHLGLPGHVTFTYPGVNATYIINHFSFALDNMDPENTLTGPTFLQVTRALYLTELLSTPDLGFGFNPALLQEVEVVGGDTPPTTSVLTNSDLATDGIDPVVYVPGDTSRIWYAQKPRSSTDFTGQIDNMTSVEGGPLEVYVQAPPPTALTVTANIAAPKINDHVTFTVHPATAVPGAKYSWQFPDGSTAPSDASATVSHTFTKAVSGTVKALLTGSGGANGAGTLAINVKGPTKPPPKEGTTPGTGSNPDPKAPATGPNSSNGNRVGAKASDQSNTSTAITDGASSSGEQQAQPQVNADAFSNLPLVTGRLLSGTATVANLAGTGAQQAPTATAPGAHVPAKWRLPLIVFVYALGALLLLGGAYSELRVYFRRTKA